ncbi:hypothetical protein [Roseimaritima multifibrata]|uniref:hypothetical protein n=1 Tax=Roseimaritima multifibrata TaxID=1930274 RepID=UPI00119D0A07|nr:hypothetical protein [Roseimaritima multifibrata]
MSHTNCRSRLQIITRVFDNLIARSNALKELSLLIILQFAKRRSTARTHPAHAGHLPMQKSQ